MACKICEKECPPQCIYIVKSEDKKPDYLGKPQFYPAVFDIDISVCMSCQICVEVCPFEAIKMDKVYELSRRERFDALLMRKSDLAKSNDYYHRIHPLEAEAVDAALAAAAAKKKPATSPDPARGKPRRGAATLGSTGRWPAFSVARREHLLSRDAECNVPRRPPNATGRRPVLRKKPPP